MTPVNYRQYHVYLDQGVVLVISLANNRSGPAVQPCFSGMDNLPFRVQLPGKIAEIRILHSARNTLPWARAAQAMGIPLAVERQPPKPIKSTPDPYVQTVIE